MDLAIKKIHECTGPKPGPSTDIEDHYMMLLVSMIMMMKLLATMSMMMMLSHDHEDEDDDVSRNDAEVETWLTHRTPTIQAPATGLQYRKQPCVTMHILTMTIDICNTDSAMATDADISTESAIVRATVCPTWDRTT